MADRCKEHEWGTCDGCGVDLGGVCCYSPHSYGGYDTLCGVCFSRMKSEQEEYENQKRLAQFDRQMKEAPQGFIN